MPAFTFQQPVSFGKHPRLGHLTNREKRSKSIAVRLSISRLENMGLLEVQFRK